MRQHLIPALSALLLLCGPGACASGQARRHPPDARPLIDASNDAPDVPDGVPDAGDVEDDSESVDAPADPPTEDTAAESDVPADAGEEATAPPPLVEESDWADCFDDANCPGHGFSAAGVEVTLDPATGLVSVGGTVYSGLDGTIEATGTHPFGYDADLIAVDAPARTLVTVLVAPAGAESAVNPFVTTADFGHPGESFAFQEITSNDDRAPGDLTARTMIASPYDDAPFYVWVDDARNVTGDTPVGGDGFTYEVTFQVAPFAPREIDVSSGSGSVAGVDLTHAGDVHYYRFVPPSGTSWQVTLSTANTAFLGYLIGFDTQGGRLQPVGYAGSDTFTQMLTLEPNAFLTDSRNEYIFAVTDWLGRGSNTSQSLFFYELAVTPL